MAVMTNPIGPWRHSLTFIWNANTLDYEPWDGTVTLGESATIDIGDVTVINGSGASAVNVQDGGNSLTVDQEVGQGRTLLYGSISQSAGTTQLVAAGGGSLRHYVVSYVVVADGAATVKFIDGSGDLTGAMSVAANGGVAALAQPASPLFRTSANSALSVVTTGNGVKGHFTYFTV